MLELQSLFPGAGANVQHAAAIWPLLLALVVFVMVTPVAWFFGHGGGKPDDAEPRRH